MKSAIHSEKLLCKRKNRNLECCVFFTSKGLLLRALAGQNQLFWPFYIVHTTLVDMDGVV